VSEALSVAVLDTNHPPHFPAECPHCGREANAAVRMTKIFARRIARGVVWIHYSVDARACQDCVNGHKRDVGPNSALVAEAKRRQAMQLGPIVGTGGAITACGLFLAGIGAEGSSRQSTTLSPAMMATIGLGAAGIGVGMVAGGWVAKRTVIVPAEWPDAQYATEIPNLVGSRVLIAAPPSAHARSLDFSDDRSDADERPWRTYSFTRQSYAREFARLNTRHVYRRGQPVQRGVLPDRRAALYFASAALVATLVWAILA
jgi:hypothetical protein